MSRLIASPRDLTGAWRKRYARQVRVYRASRMFSTNREIARLALDVVCRGVWGVPERR